MKLDVQSISAGYGKKLVIDGVGFTVSPGSIVTLLGPNGCGKSTLLKVIGRVLKPCNGCVLLDGKSVRDYSTGELAKKLATLPQLHHASGELTVEELVAYGRFPHRKAGGFTSAHDRDVVSEAIEKTRLQELRKRKMGTLSGGERQRAWIAMTLAQEPDVLLLDEPTTYLDVCCQYEIIELVKELKTNSSITVVMVLHDLNLASHCSDQLVMMKDSKVRYAGNPSELIKPDILQDIFEIKAEIITGNNGIPYCIAAGSARRK